MDHLTECSREVTVNRGVVAGMWLSWHEGNHVTLSHLYNKSAADDFNPFPHIVDVTEFFSNIAVEEGEINTS